MLAPDLQDAVVAELDRRFGLAELWLYGSEARGTARPDSDVDLGALFARPVTSRELFDATMALIRILDREVDLVDLDRVSPVLVRQVLRDGRLLVDRDPPRRRAHFVKTASSTRI